MSLPAVFWTIDDYQVDVAEWSCSNRVNLGFDQMRGTMSRDALLGLPWTSGQGSVVTGTARDGAVMWEGRLSAPPQIGADGTVGIAAQGHAYAATKSAARLPIKAVAPEAWVVGNSSPLDMPQTATAQPVASYSASGQQRNNKVTITVTSATDTSLVFWARGSRLTRFSCSQLGVPTAGVVLYVADGPNVNETKRQFYSSTTGDNTARNLEVPYPGDALIVQFLWSSPTTSSESIVDPIIYSGADPYPQNIVYAHYIGRAIANVVGWDASTIGEEGAVSWPEFDWAGDVAGALSEAVAPEDYRWRVLEDRGKGPVLELGDWSRTWEVSGAAGARWNLDALERYNRVVVSYLDALGKGKQEVAEADPDPLAAAGITNELLATVGGLQAVDESSPLAETMAAALLETALTQRYRGNINTAHAIDQDTGRDAPYEVRAGDLVKITDFSLTDGSITLRIDDVTFTPDGVQIGIAAPSYTTGAAPTTAGGATAGTLVYPNLDAYVPAGAPGSPVPDSVGIPPGEIGEPLRSFPSSTPPWHSR